LLPAVIPITELEPISSFLGPVARAIEALDLPLLVSVEIKYIH